MPVYNAARYVEKAVQSVLSQTFANFEFLILDDGSTDASLKIVQKLATTDSRIRVFTRKNKGGSASRNELIRIARGPYIAIMDSDDICRSGRLEKQIAYLNAHPDCVAVGSRVLFIDAGGMPIIEFGDCFSHEEIDNFHLTRAGGRLCHPSAMIRREALLQVGLYNEQRRYGEDVDLFLRLAEVGKLANLREVLLDYRYHLSSISFAHKQGQRADAKWAAECARTRRGIPGKLVVEDWPDEPKDTLHRKWAWWALSAGNITTARKHAILALAKNPLSADNMRAVFCALRGY